MAKGYFIFATIFGLHTFNGNNVGNKITNQQKTKEDELCYTLEIVSGSTQSYICCSTQEKKKERGKETKRVNGDFDDDDGKWRGRTTKNKIENG